MEVSKTYNSVQKQTWTFDEMDQIAAEREYSPLKKSPKRNRAETMIGDLERMYFSRDFG